MSERRFNPDNYIDVQERINRFWEEYKDGAIVTELMSDPTDFSQCRYRASIYKEHGNGKPDATGFAFEIAGTGGANRTSHEENCETSAIGRALANMGYATTRDDRPNKQEMAKVSTEKPRPIHGTPKATPDQIQKLHGEAKGRGLDHDDLHALAGLKGYTSIAEMSGDQIRTMTTWIKSVRPAELDAYLKRVGRPTIDEQLAAK